MKTLRRIIVGLVSIAIVAGIVYASVPNGPQPSVGINWYTSSDPTAGGGVAAPLAQFLVRQDVPSLYFKSGNANTAWTKIGNGAVSGGTVTSIACGTGLTCTPGSPITTSGTIAANFTGAGTLNDIAKFTPDGATVGNSSVSDNTIVVQTAEAANVGAFTDIGQLSISGSIAPASFTGTRVDNYNPTGLATTYVIDQVVTSATTITGLTAQVTGTQIDFRNSSTSTGALTFSNADANSLATNRFALSGAVNWIVPPGSSLILRYTGSDWRLLAMLTTEVPTLTVDGAETVNGLVTANAGATIAGATSVQRLVDTAISPAAITGTQNDYAPTGIATATWIRQTTSGTATITGFTGGVDGRELCLTDIGTNTITLSNQTGSISTNQLSLNNGDSWVLRGSANDTICFKYSSAVGFWQMTGLATESFPRVLSVGPFTASSTALFANTQTWSGGHVKVTGGPSPGIATCGSPGASITGSDVAGTVVEGTGGTGCTLTFNTTFTTAPSCTVTPRGIQAAFSYTPAATTLTVTNTSAETFDYVCIGH